MIWSDHRDSGSSLTLKFQWPQFLFFISKFVTLNSLFGSLFFGNPEMKILQDSNQGVSNHIYHIDILQLKYMCV